MDPRHPHPADLPEARLAEDVPAAPKTGPVARSIRTVIQCVVAALAAIPPVLATTDLPEKWDGYIISAVGVAAGVVALVSVVWNAIESVLGRTFLGGKP